MKKQIVLILIIGFCLLQQGCVVLSFYPLYTQEDLILNSKIEGKWLSINSENKITGYTWKIKNINKLAKKKEFKLAEVEANKYTYLIERYLTEKSKVKNYLYLHLVKIGKYIYADFYPVDWDTRGDDLVFTSNLLPTHSFARVKISSIIEFNWFNPEWLESLIKQNKIRIRHENNGNHILLTAKAKELQNFILKYQNIKDGFKDALQVKLKKIN